MDREIKKLVREGKLASIPALLQNEFRASSEDQAVKYYCSSYALTHRLQERNGEGFPLKVKEYKDGDFFFSAIE